MKDIVLVFIGGGLGSLARFAVGKFYMQWQPGFPYATLTSNFLSCLVFGVVVIAGVQKLNLNYTLKLLLVTGFCGGFSTYSAFTFETVELFKNGQHNMALINIMVNFALSVLGLYIGFLLGRLAFSL
ncbi:fluoride efflux transporter CrcB [Mucilaginibacter hurinus]|uniref:Fluoride-specific ion channel FluC n=1 Tax=Mucilaginibacter hurinus TaxID=2201324 RepID=A0A367GTR1_9SPHI|nr:fluoride efflux transporter CrcB [Mucilaginibacter hurinus]RCH56769.1 fluoride efflux transporter CrcB [Mucilaginibacter hurinus]